MRSGEFFFHDDHRGGSLGLGCGIKWLRRQQTSVDLAHRDRQRLLLDMCLNERSDVLQEALAQLGVVRIDLARRR